MHGIHIKRIPNPNSEFTRHVPGIHRRISDPNIEFTKLIPDTIVEFIKKQYLQDVFQTQVWNLYKIYN
jgi:hypothetical protein